jgi:multidrug resistance efflux pump
MSTSNPKGVRCAHCREYHPTIAALKLCAKRHNEAKAKAEQAAADADARAEWELERRQEQALETNLAQAEETSREAWLEEQYWGRQMQGRVGDPERARVRG